jgi:DNA repair exonuclease SbcCD ATPase subunit
VRIVSLSLRNYRVFSSLDIEIPAGLVGIYGPNGSGKSTLLESIMWSLYGRARTDKHGIRTTGSTGECLAEMVFEHDGRPYTVRRSLHGQAATVRARVSAGDQVVADGVTDCERYLRALIGMDAAAFRSSVFSEQKQLDAFVGRTPDERRKLVLQLLGITPLERARDAAKADANARANEHRRVVAVLPDLARLQARVAAAEDALGVATGAESHARAASDEAAAEELAALAEFEALEALRLRHDQVTADGRRVRAELDRARAAVARLTDELAALDARAARREALAPVAARVESLRDVAEAWGRLEHALRNVASTPIPAGAPSETDVVVLAAGADTAEAAARDADTRRAEAKAAVGAAAESLERAREALARATQLSGAEACPTCGQPLGADAVVARHHRTEEVARWEAETERRRRVLEAVDAEVGEAQRRARAARREVRIADDALRAAAVARGAAAGAHDQVVLALAHLREVVPSAGAGAAAPRFDASVPDLCARAGELVGEAEHQRAAAVAARAAADDAARELAGHDGALARRTPATAELAAEQEAVERAGQVRQALLEELQQLEFAADRHRDATARLMSARAAAGEAREVHAASALAVAACSRDRVNAEEQLDAATTQLAAAESLAMEARVLARTAELLNGFRQAMVSTVGPRLSAQASELFVELTGGEYDALVVDPERYELRIVDRGEEHPIARFSGSEVDLANLALRVAISEQVRFQAGGHVGLLVLDEALASLDSDRKDRMLLALTRLSGRFRQVLVVTHAPEVKEQLPAAIEIVRRPGRRATAAVIDATG